MRALGFLLLMLLPLSAGETDALARAVGSFQSDYASEREAASQTVRKLLQAELAPLLAALGSDDPEVSRRAHEAIRSLLPGTKKEAEPEASGNAGNVIIGLGGNQKFRFIVKQGKGGQVFFVQGGNDKESKELKKYGLEGQPITETLVRRQLQLAAGRGFGVTKVLPGTAAARLGLQAYDIVIAIGDRPVKDPKQVLKALGKKETWAGVEMRVLRVGKVVKLGGQPR